MRKGICSLGASSSNLRRGEQCFPEDSTLQALSSLLGIHPDKVSLSDITSSVMTTRGQATLQCFSQAAYSMFILMKEDEKFSMAVPAWNTYPGRFQAMFTVGPVTLNQRWRLTCFGYYSSSPQLWSVPSNHIELLVPGKEAFSFPLNHN